MFEHIFFSREFAKNFKYTSLVSLSQSSFHAKSEIDTKHGGVC